MPIYQYECNNKDCDYEEVIEDLYKLDDPVPKCPKCKKLMKKRIGTFGKHLSWAAWRTDFGAASKA